MVGVGELGEERALDRVPVRPIPAALLVGRGHDRLDLAAEEEQPTRARDDRVVGHEPRLLNGREHRRMRRRAAAPGDLQGRPDPPSAGRLRDQRRHVAHDADVRVHRRPTRVPPGRDRDGVDVDAVDVACRRVGADRGDRQARVRSAGMRRRPPGCLDEYDGMVRIECPQVPVHRHTPRCGDRRMRRLVGALPHAEAGVALDRVDDPVEQRLPAQVVVDAGQRKPQLQPVPGRRVELLRDRCELLRDPVTRPDRVVANEPHTGLGDLGPGVNAARRRAPKRRRVRQPDRKNTRPPHHQAASRRINGARRHQHPPSSQARPRSVRGGLSRTPW